MSIHKKSVISSLKTTKKANVAKESPSFDATMTSAKKSPTLRMKAVAKRVAALKSQPVIKAS